MKNNNPYSLVFGDEPQSLIERSYQDKDILDGFITENPTYRVCMITGIRGSGKTVSLTKISNEISNDKKWIVINLNPERNLLLGLTAELANRKELLQIFKDAKINLSFLGFGIEIDNVPPVTDVVVALRDMLTQITRSGKKVLLTIDEVKPNKNVREFASQIQIFIREKINIYLLMSGLYNHIDNLQNVDTLTFLLRAPKLVLEPLNTVSMKNSYKTNLEIEDDEALKMAKFTKGYAFAFQLLGYICYKNKCILKDAIDEFDAYVEEYSYSKIWSECSKNDKSFLMLVDDKPTKLQTINNTLKMTNGSLSTYKIRLIKSGIIYSPSYGYVELALPRFKEFVDRVK